jgi:hypothetical protein
LHHKVGGVTSTRALIGFRGVSVPVCAEIVSRSLNHIINASLRPQPCPQTPSFPHLASSGFLSMRNAHLPVVYPSAWSATGWGSRVLTSSKLLAALDVPSWLQMRLGSVDASLLLCLMPCKILCTVIDSWLSSQPVDEILSPPLLVVKPMEPPDPPLEWLPSLRRFLPNIWADPLHISD